MRRCFLAKARAGQVVWPLVVALLIGISGCGGKSGATVAGKVTYKGKPLRCGSVILRITERDTFGSGGSKQRYIGAIEPDGTYTILDVPQGKMKVGVISRDPSKASEPKKGETAPPVEGWFPIPNKYETPGGTDLSCDVTGAQVTYDIDLED